MVTILMPKIIDVGFNPVFREVNASRVRYRVLKGGAGSGKSFNLAQDYILKLGDPRYKGANLLVLRKVDDSNKYSTYSELCGAVQRIYGAHWEKYWRIGSKPHDAAEPDYRKRNRVPRHGGYSTARARIPASAPISGCFPTVKRNAAGERFS